MKKGLLKRILAIIICIILLFSLSVPVGAFDVFAWLASDPLGRAIDNVVEKFMTFGSMAAAAGLSIFDSGINFMGDMIGWSADTMVSAMELWLQLPEESRAIIDDVTERRSGGNQVNISLREFETVKRDLQALLLHSEGGNQYYNFTEEHRQNGSGNTGSGVFPPFPVVEGRPHYIIVRNNGFYYLQLHDGIVRGEENNGVVLNAITYELRNNDTWLYTDVGGLVFGSNSNYVFSTIEIRRSNGGIIIPAGWASGYSYRSDDYRFYHGTCPANQDKSPFVLTFGQIYTAWHFVDRPVFLSGRPAGHYFMDFRVETVGNNVVCYGKLNDSNEWQQVRTIPVNGAIDGIYLSVHENALFIGVAFTNGSSGRLERISVGLTTVAPVFHLPTRIYLNYTAGAPDRIDTGNITYDNRIFNTNWIEENWQQVINNGGDTYQTFYIHDIDDLPGKTADDILPPELREPSEKGPGTPGFEIPVFEIPDLVLPDLDLGSLDEFNDGIGFLVSIFNMLWEALGPLRYVILYSPLLAVSMYFIGKGRK